MTKSSPSGAWQKAVEENSVRKVRIMLKDSLLVDPSFKRFNDRLKASQSVKGLFDEHDGKELIQDRSQWNTAYMDRLMVQVVDNFSHERLEHLKKVVRYVEGNGSKKIVEINIAEEQDDFLFLPFLS